MGTTEKAIEELRYEYEAAKQESATALAEYEAARAEMQLKFDAWTLAHSRELRLSFLLRIQSERKKELSPPF